MELSREATNRAKKLFGDELVDNVWVKSDEYFLHESGRFDGDPKEDEIPFNGTRVLIFFSNGRVVEFGSSEYGYMGKPDAHPKDNP